MSSCWNCGSTKQVKTVGWRDLCEECQGYFGGNNNEKEKKTY